MYYGHVFCAFSWPYMVKWHNSGIIISNYWMRLSRIWRILQIKEGVIHRRPKCKTPCKTPSEICRILHILRKANSIIALLFIQNISPFRSFAISLFVFSLTKNNTTLFPGFLGQWFNNLQRAALLTSFWRHRFNNWSTAAVYGELCVWF